MSEFHSLTLSYGYKSFTTLHNLQTRVVGKHERLCCFLLSRTDRKFPLSSENDTEIVGDLIACRDYRCCRSIPLEQVQSWLYSVSYRGKASSFISTLFTCTAFTGMLCACMRIKTYRLQIRASFLVICNKLCRLHVHVCVQSRVLSDYRMRSGQEYNSCYHLKLR